MKAAQIDEFGQAFDVVKVRSDAKVPKPDENQILVEVRAASINPFDLTIIEGRASYIKLDFPSTVGGDFAGIVKETGSNISVFSVGDEVYGQAAVYAGGSGSFAQFLVASIKKVAKKPTNLNFEEAGALPLAGQSALQAIETHIMLQSGQKILIHGGAGGIGSIAIQIAKAKGAFVATTVAKEDFDFVKELGADLVLDYKTDDFTKVITGYDAVFNNANDEVANKSLEFVKEGGIVVSMTGEPDQEVAKKLGVVAIGQNTEGNFERLDGLRELVEAGHVLPQIDKIFKLNEAREAFKYFREGRPNGKVVVQVD